jgi:4a-hydroxytetrahydrobiopterin dehydratase
MVALAQRPCNPCRGGVEPLTREQCAPYLTEVPDWELTASARRITRRFQFRDYRTALAFANRKIGGLHESDFVMAARIDGLALSPLDSAWLPPLPPQRKATR